eukprot:m.929413 g.929413  ORF g.929413 m.929413 type:complete len:74 (-) comp165974_c0_seq1:405-626(-)
MFAGTTHGLRYLQRSKLLELIVPRLRRLSETALLLALISRYEVFPTTENKPELQGSSLAGRRWAGSAAMVVDD